MAARKSTTLADLIAAAALGAIDTSTVVVTGADADRMVSKAAADAALTAAPHPSLPGYDDVPAATLPADAHGCGIPDCRHGSAHPAVSQPDRQVKLQCRTCGAVARMTSGALAKSARSADSAGLVGNVYPRCADGTEFTPAPRRTYTRAAK